MAIIIKGKSKPKVCQGCFALDDHYDYPFCKLTGTQKGYSFYPSIRRMENCPLIEVEDKDT